VRIGAGAPRTCALYLPHAKVSRLAVNIARCVRSVLEPLFQRGLAGGGQEIEVAISDTNIVAVGARMGRLSIGLRRNFVCGGETRCGEGDGCKSTKLWIGLLDVFVQSSAR
jgi:hypothetical protein